MLIINNSAQYEGMPVFGNIVKAEALGLGIRPGSPTSLVNLSEKPNRAAILSRDVPFVDGGVLCGNDKHLPTNFAPESGDVTIRMAGSFRDMPNDSGVLVGLLGNWNGSEGLQLIMTTTANGGNLDYEVRLYTEVLARNGTKTTRINRQDLLTGVSAQTTTEDFVIWVKIDNANSTTSLKVNDSNWNDLRYTGDDHNARKNTPWLVGKSPHHTNMHDAKVLLKEVLVWDAALSPTEIEEQDRLSSFWLSAT